jgi:hypothetical protein
VKAFSSQRSAFSKDKKKMKSQESEFLLPFLADG